MWNYNYLRRLDLRPLPFLLSLMVMSILIIASATSDLQVGGENHFFTPYVKNQIKWFVIGWIAYLFFAALDYRKLRDWSWILYGITILMLLGLFLTQSVNHVHRWYKIPFINMMAQPSDCAKLALILTLSRFLETRRGANRRETFLQASFIVFIPFILVLMQPDLGSALILFPIALGMFYLGRVHEKIVKLTSIATLAILGFVLLIFLGVMPHETMRPFVTKVLKEYQYERFNPDTYHHQAAATAIALGKYTGSGWNKSQFTGRKFLPAAHTDSVFPAFVEEFGLIGAIFMLLLFFWLIYFSFQVTAVAKDPFGQVLSAGIAVYLATHVIINIGMMCGLLPITGVPLVLVTYGGSSVLFTMSTLGILQSVYIRRFMF